MKGTSRLAILASTIAAAATGLTMAAPSALAHEESQLPTICGSSSYFIVNDSGGVNGKAKRPVTRHGERWGYVYLLYSNTTQKNCVVTLKTKYHGTPTYTRAQLDIQNGGSYVDPLNLGTGYAEYSHYADVQATAAGNCVKYLGLIYSPDSMAAGGGRGAWGNCG